MTERFEKILSGMTLEEKAALLTGRDFWSTAEYPAYGIRSLFLSDGPHGLRKQIAASDHVGLNASLPATCFPTASVTACAWDESLWERIGEALGKEAGAQGVDVLLGPGLNIKRNPLCGRNFEYFSEDPVLSGKAAAAYVRGIQSQGVAACVKHFAANNCEQLRMVSDSQIGERTLREIYLRGFEIAVKEGGAACVMSSYNRLNGTYTNENPHLMLDILRGEWGFAGVTVTDWGGSNDRVQGLLCGNDLEMPACQYGAEELVSAVKEGRLEESALDKSIVRLLALAERTAHKEKTEGWEQAHHELARECAENSAVLLKNDGALPLRRGAKIAVVGDFAFLPRYQGAGSSRVNPTRLSTAAEVFSAGEEVDCVACVRGFRRYGKRSKRLIGRALRAAKGADVVLLFAGLDEHSETEGLDRADLRFPQNQIELYRALVAAGHTVVVLVHCGGVVDLSWAEDAAAILYLGLGGQAVAEAAYRLVTGQVNPSGKLAESWARYGDYSTAKYFPVGEPLVQYREEDKVGYRHFTAAGLKPCYPFGFGLSYTEFAYSDFAVYPDHAECTLENCGGLAGKETVQIYARRKGEPQRALLGFVKVPLQAGEKQRVRIAFESRAFERFDEEAGVWRKDGGTYCVEACASSEDVRLTAELSPQGEPCRFAAREWSEPIFEKKKRRREVTPNTTVAELRYARGWVGRAFLRVLRIGYTFCRAFRLQNKIDMFDTALFSLPMRVLAKFTHLGSRKFEGMLCLFNGKFFQGCRLFFSRREKAGKKKGKRAVRTEE